MSRIVEKFRDASPPGVSIGMPVYNMAATIGEAVTSLLAQTFGDFELLIGDNASTDGTSAICRDLAASDDRIRYVRHSENIGPARNFDFVLRGTTAPLFMWSSADDRWDRRFLEVAVNALAQHPESVTAFCNVELFDSPRAEWKHRLCGLSGGDRFRRVARYAFLRDDSGKANLIYGLHRRETLQRCRYGMSRSGLLGADYLVVGEMLLEGSAQVADETLFYKRFAISSSAGWTLFRYLWFDLRVSWGYVASARQLCGVSFALAVVPIAMAKYLRDLTLWVGWFGTAVKRRLTSRWRPRASPEGTT